MTSTFLMRKNTKWQSKNRNVSNVKNNGSGYHFIFINHFHFVHFKMEMGFIQIAGGVGRIINIEYIRILVTNFFTMIKPILCFCSTADNFTVACFQIINDGISEHGILSRFNHFRTNHTIGCISFRFW